MVAVLRRLAPFIISPAFIVSTAFPSYPAAPNFAPLIRSATPSVAFVSAIDENGKQVDSGTAFVVGSSVLLTSLSVVNEATQISVSLPGYKPLGAYVIAADVDHDLALLAVLSLPRPGPAALPLGDSAAVPLGERVVVLGFPLPAAQSQALTATQGLVSALQSQAGYLQIDAAVNPGESGAPVLTPDGQVIGIVNRTIRGAQNVNFAVPSSVARDLLARSPGGDLSNLPPNLPMTLPLTTPATIPLEFSSAGIGPHAHQTKIGVVCAPPPPRPAVLVEVNVELQARDPLHVITWLSWGKGAPAGTPAAFAAVDATTTHQFAGGLARLHLQPETVCLNYEAWNDTVLPFGLTFTVRYTLGYHIYKDFVR